VAFRVVLRVQRASANFDLAGDDRFVEARIGTPYWSLPSKSWASIAAISFSKLKMLTCGSSLPPMER
jgi:hypothetical protein